MDQQTLRTDAYLIVTFVAGVLGSIGVHFSAATLANTIVAIASALAVIVPAILAAWREIHHLNLHSVQAASTSIAVSAVAPALASIPPPPATTAPASPSYAQPIVTPALGPLNNTGGGVVTGAALQDVQVTYAPGAAPQPPAADTPTQVVAKVPDATPAPAQAATDAT